MALLNNPQASRSEVCIKDWPIDRIGLETLEVNLPFPANRNFKDLSLFGGELYLKTPIC